MQSVINEITTQLKNSKERIKQLEKIQLPIYDEGAWVPIFIGTGTAGTFTYTTQYGMYVREKDKVYVEFSVAISAITVAPTTNIEISGLPFSLRSGTAGTVTFSRIQNLVYPATALEIQGIVTGGTSVRLFYTRSNATAVAYPATSFTNTATSIIGSMVYLI